jgi:hypothetical protein
MKNLFLAILIFPLFVATTHAQEIKVSPSSVNAYSQGATSALLTYSNVKNKQPVESCWCSEVVPAAPNIGLKCNQATILGCLPVRYNQGQLSANSSYTDVMSIPPSVARRAYLDAAKGNTATFFYVRRFASTTGGADEYVPVTIRLSGNGAGVPFSVTNVKLKFAVDKPVLLLKAEEKIPQIQAEITYTGTGRLKGRWEIVKPGEELPTERDLLSEAALPIEERRTQRRYTELSRFNVYLPPTGRFTLPGPESWRLKNPVEGMYLVLLRIEATDNNEGDSNLAAIGAGADVVQGGAVAGFSMPVLRYYIGSGGSISTADKAPLTLLSPVNNAVLQANKIAEFTWTEIEGAAFYKVELESIQGQSVLQAVVLPGTGLYRAPSWLPENNNISALRWRIIALDQAGKPLSETVWRAFKLIRPR